MKGGVYWFPLIFSHVAAALHLNYLNSRHSLFVDQHCKMRVTSTTFLGLG